MENQDTAKILAKSRVKLTAAVTLMLILSGLAAEYVRQGRTLDEAVVVMMKPQAESVAAAAAEKVEPAVQTKAVIEAAAENAEKMRRNSEGAAEFIRYMQEIHERAGAVVKPESALGKIIPQQVLQTAPEPEVSVNEQVIEVYDESGEVVEIVEVRGESTAAPDEMSAGEASAVDNAADVFAEPAEVGVAEDNAAAAAMSGQESEPAAEIVPVSASETVPVSAAETVPVSEATPAESAQSEDVEAEPIVNAEENNQEIIETEADAPAIDMMKDIIARERAAAGENNISN